MRVAPHNAVQDHSVPPTITQVVVSLVKRQPNPIVRQRIVCQAGHSAILDRDPDRTGIDQVIDQRRGRRLRPRWQVAGRTDRDTLVSTMMQAVTFNEHPGIIDVEAIV